MVGTFCSCCKRRYKDKLDKEANEFIHYAVDGAERMKRLIGDLLNYSRTKERTVEKVDIGETVREALKNLTASVNDSGAMIQFEDMPIWTQTPPKCSNCSKTLSATPSNSEKKECFL